MKPAGVPEHVAKAYGGVALVQVSMYEGDLLIGRTQPAVVLDFAGKRDVLAYWPANSPKPVRAGRVQKIVRDAEALIVVGRGPRRLTIETRISPAWTPAQRAVATAWRADRDESVVADNLAVLAEHDSPPADSGAGPLRTFWTVIATTVENGAPVAIGAFAMRDGPPDRECEYVARYDREAVDRDVAQLAPAILASPTPAEDEAARLARRIGAVAYSEPAKRRAASARDAAVDALAAALRGTGYVRVER